MARFTDQDIDRALRAVEQEHLCECETCARTAAICPASASSLIQELAARRLEVLYLRNALAGPDPARLEALLEALHRLASKWTDHTIPDAHAEVTVVVEEFAAFIGEGDES